MNQRAGRLRRLEAQRPAPAAEEPIQPTLAAWLAERRQPEFLERYPWIALRRAAALEAEVMNDGQAA